MRPQRRVGFLVGADEVLALEVTCAPKLVRREDWPERLALAVATARDWPFVWGEHDCVLFAADMVQIMTGTDLAADYRGRYTDAAGAMRMMRARFAGDAAQLAGQLLGNSIPPALARRGDVVAVDSGHAGPALGICVGVRTAFPGPDGLLLVPTLGCLQAWWVG